MYTFDRFRVPDSETIAAISRIYFSKEARQLIVEAAFAREDEFGNIWGKAHSFLWDASFEFPEGNVTWVRAKAVERVFKHQWHRYMRHRIRVTERNRGKGDWYFYCQRVGGDVSPLIMEAMREIPEIRDIERRLRLGDVGAEG